MIIYTLPISSFCAAAKNARHAQSHNWAKQKFSTNILKLPLFPWTSQVVKCSRVVSFWVGGGRLVTRVRVASILVVVNRTP